MAITNILFNARVILGDLTETKYSDKVLKHALVCALDGIAADFGVEMVYHASNETITPTPSAEFRHIISLAIGMVILIGEETASALNGGGTIWRSGLSSISLATSQASISSVTKRLLDVYNKTVIDYKVGASLVLSEDFDLYQTDDEDLVGVN